jgi:hemolysin III
LIQLAEPIPALSHLLGAVVFLLLGVGLVRRGRPAPERLVSLAVYVAGVVAMLTASGLYHLAGPDHPWHAVLRRVDHAAIWLQIAGTFTPIHVIFFRGGWRRWPLVIVWTGAILGILLKLVFFDLVSEGPGLALYLALGWSGAFSAFQLLKERGWSMIAPVFMGGAFYSIGALLELSRLTPGLLTPHELFHFAVLGGVAWHWLFIHRAAGWDWVPPRQAPVVVPVTV